MGWEEVKKWAERDKQISVLAFQNWNKFPKSRRLLRLHPGIPRSPTVSAGLLAHNVMLRGPPSGIRCHRITGRGFATTYAVDAVIDSRALKAFAKSSNNPLVFLLIFF
jgi:hypothetical protein